MQRKKEEEEKKDPANESLFLAFRLLIIETKEANKKKTRNFSLLCCSF
jgi:hypothetical protein